MINSFNRRTLLQSLAGGILLGRVGKPAEIPTALVSPQSGKLNSESFGDLRVFLEGNTEQLKSLVVGSLELKPGQSPHPPHIHPEEEIMLITDGHGEISLEGKVSKVGPGTLMYAGSNREHGIVNTSSAPLTFYYFKWIGA
ncbi:MAG: cupin domain-containing protein [Acidobacteria bacterium]|nr:cupin domain-containing protein [Acidobacteriota bacterium]MBI1982652.1 cupin domain-containing protein [Acidobacteriota bacterium]